MSTSKWQDDAFLDQLMNQGDALADAAVARLVAEGDAGAVRHVFATMKANQDPLPPDTPPAIRDFWEATNKLPEGVDLDRVARGEEAFMDHLFEAGSLMLTRSLPAGYASPRLSKTLCISNDLGNRTYKRVMAVSQLLLDIGCGRGFEDGGKAVVAAQKMRLLHAGVRHITLQPQWIPDFGERMGGVPASKEDMLGTLMGFSYLVIDGLERIMGLIDRRQAEDIYYLWQVYGVMMGLHPDDQVNFDYIPADLDEAAIFYESYARRHYTDAENNPEGVYLSDADLRMMQTLLPAPMRWFGARLLPRLMIENSLGLPAMRRVGLKPVAHFPLLRKLVLDLPLAVDRRLNKRVSLNHHGHFAELAVGELIHHSAGGEVTFDVPVTHEDLERLADNHCRPCLERGRFPT